jgi:hypothetical protein
MGRPYLTGREGASTATVPAPLARPGPDTVPIANPASLLARGCGGEIE